MGIRTAECNQNLYSYQWLICIDISNSISETYLSFNYLKIIHTFSYITQTICEIFYVCSISNKCEKKNGEWERRILTILII